MNYKKMLPVMAVTVGMAAGLNMAADAENMTQDLFQMTEVNSTGILLADHHDDHKCGGDEGEHSCGSEDGDEQSCGGDHDCGADDSEDEDE